MMWGKSPASGRRLGVLVLAFLAVCIFSSPLCAEEDTPTTGVPRTLRYEGYLTDEAGRALPDGAYDLRFALYESQTGGEPVWTEEHTGVEVVEGLAQVTLGEGPTPSLLNLPFDTQYYLGITLGDAPEMVPRLRLMSTPYAFRSSMADEIADGSVTSEKLAPLSVTDDRIASVSWEKITDVPESIRLGEHGRSGGTPTPSNVWHTAGNRRTDPDEDYVGTSDTTALCFRTADQERMTILADGTVEIKSALTVEDYITSRKSSDEGGFLLADPGHGLKRVGGDDVHLFTTGGDVLLECENVGVGAPTPLAKLHVVSDATGPDNQLSSYSMLVEGDDQGIGIRLAAGGATPNGSNNFVTFFDNDGACGRIEGQTYVEYQSDPVTIATDTYLAAIAVAEGIAIGAAIIDPSAVVSLGAQLAYTGFLEAWNVSQLGVAYCSGGGDYAEWLPRLREEEDIEEGDIVGVYGGSITRRTRGAQQILPVSSSPIVLGNMPPAEAEHLFERVCFLGQAPVKVEGPVDEGDYIIPSGLDDGVGVAVAPEMMTASEFAKVVGRAWTSSDQQGVKLVNVAVGLGAGDVAAAVQRQESATTALMEELAAASRAIRGMQTELDAMRSQVLVLDELAQEVDRLRAAASVPRTPEQRAAGDES
jgi:hypothetical protein